MPKLDPPIREIADEEEARIQAGIAADPENPAITAEEFATARRLSETLPTALYAALTRGDRPRSEGAKEALTLSLDPLVIATFKAAGADWQVRMREVLERAADQMRRGSA